MSLLEAVRNHLLADPTIAALVEQRIYPLTVPESEANKDLIVCQRIDDAKSHSKSGPTGLKEAHIQFTCKSMRLATAQAIADAINSRIDGFKGYMGGLYVNQVRSEPEMDIYEPPPVDLYQVLADYIVSYQEVQV